MWRKHCETGTSKLKVTVSVCCLPRLKQETEVAPSVFLEQALPVSVSDTQKVQVVSLPHGVQVFVGVCIGILMVQLMCF